MSVALISPLFHFWQPDGSPAVGWKVYTYLNGTTTDAPTYTDVAGTTPNTNPIVLDSRGEATIFLTPASTYTFYITDAAGGNPITIDNIAGPLSSLALADYAPLASPNLTGNPTVPTQAVGNNSTRAASTAFVATAVTDGINGTNKAATDCQLTISGASLLLSRCNGKYLTIDGELRDLTSSGPTLAIGAASTNTTYYIYAAWSGTAVTLSFSATAFVVDSTTGLAVMNGDATKTFVGLARTNASPAWSQVRSYYNDPGLVVKGTYSTDRSTASATFAELNSEIRCSFLAFADDIVSVQATGGAVLDVGPGDGYAFIAAAFDGTTQEDGGAVVGASAMGGYAAADWSPINLAVRKTGLSAGYHYATIVGRTVATSGGPFSVYAVGSGTAGERTTLIVTVKR